MNNGIVIIEPLRARRKSSYVPRQNPPGSTKLRLLEGELCEERAPRNAQNSLKHYENISREVLEFMRKHNWEDVPPESFFKKRGRGDIVSAARTYFGGILGLRAEMAEKGDLKLEC